MYAYVNIPITLHPQVPFLLRKKKKRKYVGCYISESITSSSFCQDDSASAFAAEHEHFHVPIFFCMYPRTLNVKILSVELLLQIDLTQYIFVQPGNSWLTYQLGKASHYNQVKNPFISILQGNKNTGQNWAWAWEEKKGTLHEFF